MIPRIAPITPHMILNFIAEKALGSAEIALKRLPPAYSPPPFPRKRNPGAPCANLKLCRWPAFAGTSRGI